LLFVNVVHSTVTRRMICRLADVVELFTHVIRSIWKRRLEEAL